MATVWPRPAEMDHGTTLSGRTPRLKFPPWRSLASHQTTTKWYRRGGTNSTPSRISVPPSPSSARTSVVANRMQQFSFRQQSAFSNVHDSWHHQAFAIPLATGTQNLGQKQSPQPIHWASPQRPGHEALRGGYCSRVRRGVSGLGPGHEALRGGYCSPRPDYYHIIELFESSNMTMELCGTRSNGSDGTGKSSPLGP
jgi:hypothetical protein